MAAWLGWLTEWEIDALAAGRVHFDLWATTQLDAGSSSAARKLVDLLEDRGDLDGAEQILRVPADAGDSDAAGRLATRLAGLHRL